jgi:hypothetical protein
MRSCEASRIAPQLVPSERLGTGEHFGPRHPFSAQPLLRALRACQWPAPFTLSAFCALPIYAQDYLDSGARQLMTNAPAAAVQVPVHCSAGVPSRDHLRALHWRGTFRPSRRLHGDG